jgi:DNA-directed RNA polymerase specialized sigma24 family protein
MSTNFSDRFNPADAAEFKRIVDAIAESVLEISDEEILQEIVDDRENAAEAAESTRSVLLKALCVSNRQAVEKVPVEHHHEPEAKTRPEDWDSVFVRLYDTFLRTLRGRYPRISAIEAEDCVQEAIIRVYERWNSLHLESTTPDDRLKVVQSYLWHAVRNAAFDHMRQNKYYTADGSCDQRFAKSRRPPALILSSAYKDLTSEERRLLEQRVLHNKSYLDIQRDLRAHGAEVSVAAIKARYSRAIQKIRSTVEQEVSGPDCMTTPETSLRDDFLLLGHDGTGQPILLGPRERAAHVHILGSSGSGKSKFLEWMIRADLHDDRGFVLLDPHGGLYDAVVKYCAHHVLNREIVLLDISDGTNVVGFNPFRKTDDPDISTRVDRRIAATLGAWNNDEQSPRLEKVLRLLFTEMLERDLTIAQIQHLIVLDGQHRTMAMRELRPTCQNEVWSELDRFLGDEWRDNETVSARNRLLEFFSSPALTRFMGLSGNTLDLKAIMDAGRVILVNLAPSEDLSARNARVFGALLVNELFEAAMARQNDAREPRPFYVYIDEFQNFMSGDISKMLGQARHYGLLTILAHQHLGQLDDNLARAVVANCRIKAVFGGLPESSARVIAERMFFRDLDSTRIFVAIYQMNFWRECSADRSWRDSSSLIRSWCNVSDNHSRLAHECFEPAAWFDSSSGRCGNVSYGWTHGSGSSSHSWSCSDVGLETDVPVFIPVPCEELARAKYHTRDQELRSLVDALKEQWQRHCFVKIDREQIQPMRVPFVETLEASERTVNYYVNRQLAKQGALPAWEVDELIEAEMRRLLEDHERNCK